MMKNMMKVVLVLLLVLLCGFGMTAQAEEPSVQEELLDTYATATVTLTDGTGQAYASDYEFEAGDTVRFKIEMDLTESSYQYGEVWWNPWDGKWYEDNPIDCTYKIREAYRQGYVMQQEWWGQYPVYTQLPQISTSTQFMIPFVGAEYLNKVGLPTEGNPNEGKNDEGTTIFWWWFDETDKCIRLTFTEEALSDDELAITDMFVALEGTLNADAIEGLDEVPFTVANQPFNLPLAQSYELSKSGQLVYNQATRKYEVQYSLTVNLRKDQNLSEKPLSITDTHGSAIGEPQAGIQVVSSAGNQVSVSYENGAFKFSSPDNVLTKGDYTITYTADLASGWDENLSDATGDAFNNQYSGERKNTAEVVAGNEPTGVKAEAEVYYTSLNNQAKIEKYQAGTDKPNINGVYIENGNYYVDYYIDVKFQSDAGTFTVSDDGGEWLSHIAGENPTVLYCEDGWWYVDASKLEIAQNVGVSYKDNGDKRTFTVTGTNGLMPAGTYRIKYRMQLDAAVADKALATGKDVIATNTAKEFSIDGRGLTEEKTVNVTIPTYKATDKAATNMTLADGTKVTKWEVRFQWNFFQNGKASAEDVLTNGNFHVSAETPFTISNSGNKIVSLTNPAQTAGGLTLTESGFVYELGKSGHGAENTAAEYVVTYYTKADMSADGVTLMEQTNTASLDYNGDGVVDDEAIETIADESQIEKHMEVLKSGAITEVDKANNKVTIQWTVTVDLQEVPYDQLDNWSITDAIPEDTQSIMKLTAAPVVTLTKADNATVQLTEGTHYDLTTTADGLTQTVAFKLDALRAAADTCKQVTLLFTAEGANNASGSTEFKNTAVTNYAYGNFDLNDSADGSVTHEVLESRKDSNLRVDIYNQASNAYGWGIGDGKMDYVYTLVLRDKAFVNRGKVTRITVADTLPALNLDGQTIVAFEVVPGSVKASSSTWDYESGARFITPVSVSASATGFTASFDLPADWPNDTVYLYYSCDLTDEFRANLKGDQWFNAVINRASVTWDGIEQGLMNLSSLGLEDDRIDKISELEGSDGRGYMISYSIKINPHGLDLMTDSDVMTLTDRFANRADEVSYNRSNFVLKDGNGNTMARAAYASDSTYLLSFADDGTSFEITVPDGKAMTLSYDVSILTPVGEKTNTIRNTVSLTGVNKTNEVDSFVVSMPTEGVDTVIQPDERAIKIFKEEALSGILLEGAEFTAYTVGSDLSLTPTDKVVKTNSAGMAMFKFTEEELDEVYAIKETKAPEGYASTDKVWYFCFSKYEEGEPIALSAKVQAIVNQLGSAVTHHETMTTYEYTAVNEKVAYGPGAATLDLTKNLTSNADTMHEAQSFEFAMEWVSAKDAQGVAKTTGYEITDGKETITYAADKSGETVAADAFAVSFTEPGVYVFKVTEMSGNDLSYVTYDDAVYYVQYVVSEPADSQQTALQAAATLFTDEALTEVADKAAFTNAYSAVDIEIVKRWEDNGDAFGLRGDVTLTLWATVTDASGVTATTEVTGVTAQKTKIDADSFRYAFTGLPGKDQAGNAIIYSVKEIPLDGYFTAYENASGQTDAAYADGTICNALATAQLAAEKVMTLVNYTDAELAEASRPADAFQFSLTPDAAYTGVQVFLEGSELKEENGAYSVTVTMPDTMTNGQYKQAFPLNFVFRQAGTYTFTLKETVAAEETNWLYDTAVRTVTFVVEAGQTGVKVSQSMAEGVPASFENKYYRPTEITIMKAWIGSEPANKDISASLVLYQVIDDVEMKAADSLQTAIYSAADGSYTWSGLPTITSEGKAILYRVKEESVLPGYTVTYPNGQAYAVDGETITNTYAADGSVIFAGSKTLTGKELTAEAFSFVLTDGAGNEIETVKNKADGSFAFSEIEYGLDDVDKTYTYKVKEVPGAEKGITYDPTEYTVTVKVEDNGDGTLKVTTSENASSLKFTNTYAADGSVIFAGSKTLTGKDLTAEAFSFVLTDGAGNEIETVKNKADGSFAFSEIEYGLDDVDKTYTYKVKEVNDKQAGITYDPTEYTVTVKVEDNGDGTLKVTASENASSLKFTNTYAATASLLLNAFKTVDGKEPTEDQVFDFILTGDGVEMKAQNQKSSIVFGTLHFDLEDAGKTYTYTIRETTASTEAMKADDSVYEVSVTISDKGDGTLNIQPVITRNGEAAYGVVFDNQQLASLTISKKVEGPQTDEAFNMSLHLYDAEGAELTGTYPCTGDVTGMIASGGSIALKADQSVTITGLPEGAKYRVEEIGSKAYTTTVNGQAGTAAEGTLAGADNRVDFVNKLELTTFSVTKVWEGNDLGAIVLTLYANGEEMVPQPEVTRADNIYTYYDLQKYDEDGDEIIYSAKERGIEGYIRIYKNIAPYADVTRFVHDGGTIINRPEKIVSFKIQKVWTGLAEGEEKPDITLTLYCNGVKTDYETPKPDSNGWYKYYNLPTTVDGQAAVYTVKEKTLSGFVTTYTNAAGSVTEQGVDGGTITNAKIPQTGDDASLALWMMLMGASAALMAVLMRRRKAC